MSRLFISHSSVDNAAALAVAEWLTESGWDDYFLDVSADRGLVPGQRWQEALKSAADRCEAVLFLISPAWCASTWCQAEYLVAKQLGKKIFAATIEPIALNQLPPELTAEWQVCDLAAGADRRTFRVSSDQVVPPTTISLATGGLERLKAGLLKAGIEAATFLWPPPADPERPPYRGLKTLEPEDAAVFFGRDVAIMRGLDALRAIRERGVEGMLVILGASGAGKSSFLRAGLWPRLERDDRFFLPLPVIRPQGAVMSGPSGLVTSFDLAFRSEGVARTRAELRAIIRSDGGFARLSCELQAAARRRLSDSIAPSLLLCIDQGEELFINEGRLESEDLLRVMAETLTRPRTADRPDVIALVAIRSDAYDRLQSEPQLAAVAQAPFNLSPVGRTEFRQIIVGPAERSTAAGRRLRVDPVLVDQLLHDADGADALPLLAFTLERLFLDYGGDAELSASDYTALGGVRGSIEAAVDAALAHPDQRPIIPDDRAECERLLKSALIPWLAQIDPDSEAPRRRVARWEEIPGEARSVVERLVNARLLVRDRREADEGGLVTSVEVAHEALLRQWPTLTKWLDEDADALKTAESVRRAASEWVKNRRQESWLSHTGDRLNAAEAACMRSDLGQLVGDEGSQYLQECRARDARMRADREAQIAQVALAQQRTARAQRLARRLLAAVGVALVILAVWVVRQGREVARQRARVLIGNVEDALNRGAYARALRFALIANQSSWLSPSVPRAEAALTLAAQASREVATLAHSAEVDFAAFSEDGSRLMTSAAGLLRVWDATTWRELSSFRYDGGILAWNDKRFLAVTRDDKTQIWEVPLGTRSQPLAIAGQVRRAHFSADGTMLITLSSGAGPVLWDGVTGARMRELSEDTASSARFSAGTHRVVTTTREGIDVWDADTGLVRIQVAWRPDNRTDFAVVRGAALNRDESRIVGHTDSTAARLFEATTGTEIARLSHDGKVIAVEFSGNGTRVMTVSDDHAVALWDAQTGKPIARMFASDELQSVDLSADGQRVVMCSENSATVWDGTTGQLIARLNHDGTVRRGRFSADGQRVVTASADASARVWDVRQDRQLTWILRELRRVEWAEASPKGDRIVGAVGTTARVWDAANGREIARIDQGDQVFRAAYSGDGSRFITVSYDMTARVYDAENGTEIARATHDDPVKDAWFSPDGSRFLTVTGSAARLWHARNGGLIATLSPDAGLSQARFSPDGKHIATAGGKTLTLWDAETGTLQLTIDRTDAFLADFSADGRRILAGSGTQLLLLDARTGRLTAELPHSERVYAARFSASGALIVSVSNNAAVIWDARSLTQIAQLAHHAKVMGAMFSLNDTRLLTIADDGMVRIWDAPSGTELARLPWNGEEYSGASFGGDGRWLVIASRRNLAVWDTSTLNTNGADLVRAVCGEKLTGAQRLTAADVAAAPVLAGREGEDVCARPSALQRLAIWR